MVFSVSSLRILSIAIACSLLNFTSPVYAQKGNEVPELNNLQTLGKQAREQQLPILLMFSAEWCEYCEVLKEQVLTPMMRNGLYEAEVVFLRNVGIDLPEPIPDWNGKPLNKDKWAYELNADLTPTVLFFDGKGNEVADRIIGVPEITLFSVLIHSRLNQAYKNMGLDKQIPATPEKLLLQMQKK